MAIFSIFMLNFKHILRQICIKYALKYAYILGNLPGTSGILRAYYAKICIFSRYAESMHF